MYTKGDRSRGRRDVLRFLSPLPPTCCALAEQSRRSATRRAAGRQGSQHVSRNQRRPRRRPTRMGTKRWGRRAWRGAVAAGVGLAAALLAGCGTAGGVKDPGSAVRVGSPTGHSPAGHSRALAPATALRRSEARQPGVPAGCALPKLPVAGAGPKRDFPMTGPAVRDLRGGADRHRFSLDGGGLVVAPPGSGSAPAVSRRDAECAALASTNASGFGFEDMARQAGVALGYGRVSIRGGLRLATPPADYGRPVATEPVGAPVGP